MSAVLEPPVETIDKPIEELDTVTIRFAGDSGDGMQLTGTQFTNTSAIVGNDISTLPDFPAEIRAPAGSLPGVSGFQLNFSSQDIRTPGDQPNVLVAMNPAALKVNLADLEEGGTLIINTDEFTKDNLAHAAYSSNPLEDGSLSGYRVHELPITTLNMNALKGNVHLSRKEIDRSKNFFALGGHKNYGVKTFQAEDEIAAVCAAIGASFTGHVGLTGTSGPGVALKQEAIGLAVMTELPLVIINVQRGGPSTGLPTKTEQADLFQAVWGRNGECPAIVLAPATPADCFDMAIEAVRLAFKYMVPVFYLSDGYLANGAEPWRVPEIEKLPRIEIKFETNPTNFMPYARDEKTLARHDALPGTPGLEHRIGGIEKQHITGNVNYDPENHHLMVRLRQEKVDRAAADIPPVEVFGDASGKVLVLGWGSTYGSITSAVEKMRNEGKSVSSAHLRHLNPFPKNLGDVLASFETVIIPEMNLGQLCTMIRAQYLIDEVPFSKVKGRPFQIREIVTKVEEYL